MVTAKFGIIRNGQTLRVILKFCEMLELNYNKSWNSLEMIPQDNVLLRLREHCRLVQTVEGHVMAIQFYAIKSAQSSSKIKI